MGMDGAAEARRPRRFPRFLEVLRPPFFLEPFFFEPFFFDFFFAFFFAIARTPRTRSSLEKELSSGQRHDAPRLVNVL